MKKIMKKIFEFIFSSFLLVFALLSAVLAAKLDYGIWWVICFLILTLLAIRKIRLSEFKLLQKINKKISSNFKEKFEKIKFLIPLMVGLVIVYFICATDAFDSKVMMSLGVMFLLSFRINHHWKMGRNEKYREWYIEYKKEQKELPWAMRDRHPNFDQMIFLISLLCIIIGGGFLANFFYGGFVFQKWNFSYLVLAVFFLLIFSFFFVSYYLVIYRFRNYRPKIMRQN